MSDYFARFPEVVMRKIYGNLENSGKLALTEMMEEDGKSHVLENTGVHNHKQRFSCFLCQVSILFEEFGVNDINRHALGFNWMYKNVDEQERGGLRIVEYERRKHNLEDMAEADRILHYFEIRLASVYSTCDCDELQDHIIRVHRPHNYLPPKSIY